MEQLHTTNTRTHNTFRLCAAFAAVLLLTVSVDSAKASLLLNGSFEDDRLSDGQHNIRPMHWSGSGGYIMRNTGYYPPPLPVPDGDQVYGVIEHGTTLSQDFSLDGISTLLLTYWDAREQGCVTFLSSSASIFDLGSGSLVATSPQFTSNSDTWKQNSWVINDLNAGNYRLTLSLGGEEAYDNVALTVVPEPATYIAGALLLLPLGVQGIRYLRRSRAA